MAVDYVSFGIIIALLIGVGLLFILRSKSNLRWVGYVLMFMTVLLVVMGIIHYFAEASHSRGH